MKIELTVKTNYLPNWGVYEGVRELIQNAKDGESEFKALLKVRHRDPNTLIIENEGVTLPHEALLFGHTTKSGKEDLIGKFGEGLKLGVLALVRSGHEVKIRSGSEIWTPVIERSEKFDADVLVFYIDKNRKEKNRIQIEVFNITKEEWELLKPCFLFLNKDNSHRIDTHYGAVLLRESEVGKLYVKGIFVEHEPQFRFGFDLTHDVDVDRDRKMIARCSLDWRVRSILAEAACSAKFVQEYLSLVQDNAKELLGLGSYEAKSLPKNIIEKAAEDFKSRHGVNAIPVETLAESKDIAHLGKTGIVVNKPLKAVLEAIFGTVEENITGLANEIVRSYGWDELSTEERSSLEEAITLVNAAESATLLDIDVVDFRSSNILGMFKDGRVSLAKNKLLDKELSLETLVHEVAHRNGKEDGSPLHVATIEKIWSKIVSNLRRSLSHSINR